MDFDIRLIAATEYDTLAEITAQAYLQGGLLDFGEQDPYLVRLRDVEHRATTAQVLVAVTNSAVAASGGEDDEAAGGERLLGGVTYVPGPGPMADLAREGEAEIRTLAVAPEARGRGVGEALTRACLDRARTAGFRRVVLCSQTRMLAAHRLYERLGFTRTPERDWSPTDKVDTFLIAYALELNDHPL